MKYCKLLVLYSLSLFAMNAVASFSLGTSYNIDASWDNGYEVTVTLNNSTGSPTTSWSCSFDLGVGQTMSNPWNGMISVNGPTFTVINPTWAGGQIVPANGSATFGFIVNNPQATTPALTSLTAMANGNYVPLLEAYWESWNATRDPLASIVDMHFDIVDVAFVTFSLTDSITDTFDVIGLNCDQSTLDEFVTLVHGAGKKVKISVGGATYPLAGLLTSNAAAQGMANAIAAYVTANQLDGVDFDIEDYDFAPDWGTLQIALIQDTRVAIGDSAIMSYTPKTPTSSSFAYDVVSQGVYSTVDAINIQAYDYGYPQYTYQADVMSMVDTLGIPISKIGIGLLPGSDDITPIPYITTLANIQTAGNYILTNGLVGMMIWNLNRDFTDVPGAGSQNRTNLGCSTATTTAWNIFHP
jgi:chitinase